MSRMIFCLLYPRYIYFLHRHAQLLANSRILLIVDDKRDSFLIYLESLHTIGAAVARQGCKRKINQVKLGRDILIAYDEDKRTLVLCSASKVRCRLRLHNVLDSTWHCIQVTLHIMAFDETFGTSKAGRIRSNLRPGMQVQS